MSTLRPVIYVNTPLSGSYSWNSGYSVEPSGFSYFRDRAQTCKDNPNWRSQIQRHQDASTPYSCYGIRRAEMGRAAFSSVSKSNGNTYFGIAYGKGNTRVLTAVPANSATIVADDIANGRLRRRLSDLTGDVKSLVSVGELKESIDLVKNLGHSANTLVSDLMSFRHGPQKFVKRASQRWLEFSFGISPLVSDINSHVNAIKSTYEAGGVFTKRGFSNTEWTESPTNLGTWTAGVGPWNTNSQGVTDNLYKYKVGYAAGVLVKPDVGYDYLSKHFGLSFGEILSAGWELIPYSWLLDYFGTIGDVISSYVEVPSYQTIYVTVSRSASLRSVENCTPWFRNFYNDHKSPSVISLRTAHFDSYAFQRTVLAAIPTRALRFKTFPEISGFSTTKLLNLASLLVK